MDAIITYPKASFHTLTYCEEKDYILSCLHEAYKGVHHLYHNEELDKEILKVIADVENCHDDNRI